MARRDDTRPTFHGVVARFASADGIRADEAVDLRMRRRGTRGGPNAALVFTGMWVGGENNGTLDHDAIGQLRHLQQVVEAASQVDQMMLDSLHRRRRTAADVLAARSGRVVREVIITPMWRVVVGHGADDNYETGLSFSRTYGLPVWSGSGLKGVAAAQAIEDADQDTLIRLFGSPRPGDPDHDGRQGGVVVLDALPEKAPKLVVDVLTPHQTEYYAEVNQEIRVKTPPAEYHNPVPVRFLAVGRTPFRTLLIGKQTDVAEFREFLKSGVDDLGLGGKTAAGYGYCELEDA